MLAQAGKLQNERLGQLRAAHTWDELAGGGSSLVMESDFSGGPDLSCAIRSGLNNRFACEKPQSYRYSDSG